ACSVSVLDLVSCAKRLMRKKSDVNLVRDKFLKEKTLENDGCTFNSFYFNDEIFFEIDEENKKIRRSKDIPLPAISFRKYLDQNKNNIFYITKYVKMLADKNKKFSGTIYVLCDTDASSQLLADKSLNTEYEESSDKEIGVSSKKRKSSHTKEKSNTYSINALLRIRDLPTTIKSKDIKNVEWVDRNEDGSAIARFSEDNSASFVVENLKDTDGKLKIGDIELIVE
ncbi:hypothetical protein MXB_1937, partial [Myxobolus squamalis]